VKKKFKELLHHYKVEAFKISHGQEQVAEITREILRHTEEALNNAYRFHIHGDASPQRIETFNMIKHFTLEALLPPVMEKVMRRITVLEKQHTELVRLVGEILETLSHDHSLDAQVG
jgi:hypothetical protein